MPGTRSGRDQLKCPFEAAARCIVSGRRAPEGGGPQLKAVHNAAMSEGKGCGFTVACAREDR